MGDPGPMGQPGSVGAKGREGVTGQVGQRGADGEQVWVMTVLCLIINLYSLYLTAVLVTVKAGQAFLPLTN